MFQLELHIQQIIIHLHVLIQQFFLCAFFLVGFHPLKLAALSHYDFVALLAFLPYAFDHRLGPNTAASKRALFLAKTRSCLDHVNLTVSHARPLVPFWFGQLIIIIPGEAGGTVDTFSESLQPSKQCALYHREVRPPTLAPIPLNHSHASSSITNCVAAGCRNIQNTPLETLVGLPTTIIGPSAGGILVYLHHGGVFIGV